jgi:hypothetical protein
LGSTHAVAAGRLASWSEHLAHACIATIVVDAALYIVEALAQAWILNSMTDARSYNIKTMQAVGVE